MGAAILVIVLGLGVGALGLLVADLFVAGLLIVFAGLVGAAVVIGDRVMRYAQRRPPV